MNALRFSPSTDMIRCNENPIKAEYSVSRCSATHSFDRSLRRRRLLFLRHGFIDSPSARAGAFFVAIYWK